MLFMPYRPDIGLDQIPFVTIFVCLICLVIYADQSVNEGRVIAASQAYCEPNKPLIFRLALERSVGSSNADACNAVMREIHLATDKQQVIADIAANSKTLSGYSKQKSQRYISVILSRQYRGDTGVVPLYATQQLWYDPQSWDWKSMISAAFAHGSWVHVLGNLFFFFAFATAVEMIIGHLRFVLLIAGLAIGTHIVYSLAMIGVENAAPTVGLSGVVMGMMAMFAFFMPAGRIRCFFWFLLIVRRFSLPAWLLFSWYVGWDVYALLTGDGQSGINIVAHVSGAAIGFMTGVLLFRKRRQQITALVRAHS
jgi:membrane associated rhomboid family serine protease